MTAAFLRLPVRARPSNLELRRDGLARLMNDRGGGCVRKEDSPAMKQPSWTLYSGGGEDGERASKKGECNADDCPRPRRPRNGSPLRRGARELRKAHYWSLVAACASSLFAFISLRRQRCSETPKHKLPHDVKTRAASIRSGSRWEWAAIGPGCLIAN